MEQVKEDMSTSQKIQVISGVLKTRFPNLTVNETIDITIKIMEALRKMK